MPRPLWNGAISFGPVTIPVKLMGATEDRSVRFHQVHTEDLGRVRVRKYCEAEDREVSAGEIGKGFEVSKDTLVAVTDEELEKMPLPTAKAIEIVAFVPAASIDPVRLSGDSYFLQYDGQVAVEPYVLIARALTRNTKVAVAKLAWHGRERLVLLRVRDGALVAHVLKWDDEVPTPPSSPRRTPRSRTPRSTRPCCWSNRDRVRRSEGEVHPPRRVHPRR
jgi:DNA end-binding protein Ku